MKFDPTFASGERRPDVSVVAAALASNAESVFLSLLGKPTSRSSRELRYGSHGSLAVSIAGARRGRWSDFEAGTSGDLIDLIMRERRVTLPEALQIAIQDYLSGHPIPAALDRLAKSRPAVEPQDESKASYWRGLWRGSTSIIGTNGHRFYAETRGIDVRGIPLDHCVRWHEGISAIVALMRDPITGEPIGLHRTFLDANAAKIDRRMIGRQGVIELSSREEVDCGLGLAEGVEDGLAVLASGWRPVWAATSAGAIAKFPVIGGIDCLTVFGDADVAGNSAATECAGRWIEHGREAATVLPPQREVSL